MFLETIANKRAVSANFTKGGMMRPIRGLVLHIQQGTEAGTFSWFNNSKAKVSAHFGNPKQGRLEQFVDIDDVAWAQMAGNHQWISVENEGKSGDALTESQLENLGQLLGWLHLFESVPLQLADNPAASGLGYHAMGGASWGGHSNCPGEPIIGQRMEILKRATFHSEGDFEMPSGDTRTV